MNEEDQNGVFSPPLGSQEGMKSSASVQNEVRKCSCSPFAENQRLFLQQSRPGLVSALLPTDSFFFFFFHWWEEVLLSPQPCAGEPQSVVVLGLLGPESDS